MRQVALAALLAFGTQAVLAQPVGGQVVGGAASITHGANLTQIQQQSQRAIINWQSFGIPAGQTVQFQQPNAQAAILNRVTGALPTHIDGRLAANGQVFLVNPNGIVVGANGVISAQGGFVGSTQSISDAAFMAGAGLSFDGGSDGRMEVLGRIESANGPITLIAPKLSVGASASLKAGSSIQLIAASQVQLSNGRFTVIPKPGDAGELTQSGVLEAAQVQLAAVNQNLGALAINTSGTIRANATQTNPDGSVSIVATGPARVELHDASITATGADGKGGRIDVSGERTGLFGQTVLDASGAAGGGSVRVGGGWQGKEADLPNAQVTYVEEGVKLKADATLGGDGGRIVVWADDTTRYAGALSARGAGLKADGTQGAGGSAEVSGKGTLQFTGTADLRGASDQAQTGTLLLDPSNITIDAVGPDDNYIVNYLPSGATYVAEWTSSTAGDSVLLVASLVALLSTNDVVVQTSAALQGTGGLGRGAQNDGIPGDIWVKDPVNWSSPYHLTLRAHDDVIIDGAITSSGGGRLVVNDVNLSGSGSASREVLINQALRAASVDVAGGRVQVLAPIASTDPAGRIRLSSGADLDVRASLDAAGAAPVVLQAGLSGAGDIVLQGRIASAQGEVNLRAAGRVVQGADIETDGNVFVQAGDALVGGAGAWVSRSGTVALLAGAGMGSADARVVVQAPAVVVSSSGDQFVELRGPATRVAAISLSGAVDVLSVDGGVTAAPVAAQSGLDAVASGGNPVAGHAGLSAVGVLADRAVRLTAPGPAGDLWIEAPVRSTAGDVDLSAGRDLFLRSGAAVQAPAGAVTWRADTAAGSAIGPGRVVNEVAGLDILAAGGAGAALFLPSGATLTGGSGPTAGLPRFVPSGLRVNGVLVSTAEALANVDAAQAPAGAAITFRIGTLVPRPLPPQPAQEQVISGAAATPSMPLTRPFPVWGLPSDGQDSFTMQYCGNGASGGALRSPAPGSFIRIRLPAAVSQERAGPSLSRAPSRGAVAGPC